MGLQSIPPTPSPTTAASATATPESTRISSWSSSLRQTYRKVSYKESFVRLHINNKLDALSLKQLNFFGAFERDPFPV